MTVVLKNYHSKSFPVIACWDKGRSSAVYESVQAARVAMEGRFGKVRFIDRTQD